MVTSEALPYAKTGGLADAVPALSDALKSRGHDVRIVMPHYHGISGSLRTIPKPLGVPMGDQERWCGILETTLPGAGVPVYFLDRKDLYNREGLYGPDGGSSWPDNALRFAFLSAAAFQLCLALNWIPHVVHAHDWPSAPAAFLLSRRERKRGFENTASVLSIHNLGYQGVFDSAEAALFPTPHRAVIEAGGIRGDGLNFLALGLHSADALSTVSPTYAEEILNPKNAHGLYDILNRRSGKLTGILNGMDYSDWNPSTDPVLGAFTYDRKNMAGKAELKALLQRTMGLPEDPETALFGIVARLTTQKGLDLLLGPSGALERVLKSGKIQMAVLGSGEKPIEEGLRALAVKRPDSLALRIAFDPRLSHLVEAGSDFFLMPSRYEPCGLNQMYSLRYGTLPVVRRTGGLADTVTDLAKKPRRGTGLVFDQMNSQDLAEAMIRARDLWTQNPKLVNAARRRGMALRFDWNRSARAYEGLYRRARRSASSPS